MDGFRVGGHGSLLKGLSQGRVSMTRPGNVLTRSAVLDGQSGFGDHLAGIGADDVHTQDAVGLCIGNELDETLGLQVGLSAGVGTEGEGSDTVVNTGFLDFGFVLANPRDFGVGVHDTGDGAVVDVTVALLDVFDGGNALLLSLVGKHRTESAVTNDTDMRVLGAELLVNHQTTLLVLLDASVLQAKTLGVGTATNGDQDNISIQGLLLPALGGLEAKGDGGTTVITLSDLGTGLELDALLAQDLLGLLGDLRVHTGATNLVQELHDGNFGSKTRPDGSLELSVFLPNRERYIYRLQWFAYHLKTNDTTTNHNHLIRDLLELESTGAGDNSLLVDVQAGEGSRFAASGNEDVFPAQDLLTPIVEVDLDSVRVGQGTGTLDVIDAVLLEQELNTLGQSIHRGVLGLHHLLQVELDLANLDTALLCVMENLVVEVGVVEKGLRRDTANVKTSTTQTATLFDTCGLIASKSCISFMVIIEKSPVVAGGATS